MGESEASRKWFVTGWVRTPEQRALSASTHLRSADFATGLKFAVFRIEPRVMNSSKFLPLFERVKQAEEAKRELPERDRNSRSGNESRVARSETEAGIL